MKPHKYASRAPLCRFCGKPLRRFRWRKTEHAIAAGRVWGDYGDGFFCGRTCGYAYAVAVMQARTS